MARQWKHSTGLSAFGWATVIAVFCLGGCNSAPSTGAAKTVAEPYAQEGDATAYGIPLSVSNAAQFVNYYNTYKLTSEQDAIKREALTALVAPCCDDNTMYTCCCPCNLAKSVWGLSAYLIVEKGYNAAAVRQAALQWLQFIRPDYYRAIELEQQGLNPRDYGLRHSASCYEGKCELPFSEGGCAGMNALKLQ